MPPHGKTKLVKTFIINYLKKLMFQKAVPKAVHRQTKTLYEYSNLRNHSGNRTYSITAKRMISGLVLKCLSGECFVIRRGYGTALHGSSSFYLTVPSCRTFADTDRCDRPLLRLPRFVQHVLSSVHCRHLAVSNVITGPQYAGLHLWPLGRRLCPRLSSRY